MIIGKRPVYQIQIQVIQPKILKALPACLLHLPFSMHVVPHLACNKKLLPFPVFLLLVFLALSFHLSDSISVLFPGPCLSVFENSFLQSVRPRRSLFSEDHRYFSAGPLCHQLVRLSRFFNGKLMCDQIFRMERAFRSRDTGLLHRVPQLHAPVSSS